MTICQNRRGTTWTSGAASACCEAAMAEFGRHGYSGGSLNVIAREAGVAKGSLFQYFDDKLDFFAHVAEQTSLTIYAAMAPHLGPPPHGRTVRRPPRRSGRHLDGLHGHASARARRHRGDDDGTRSGDPPRRARTRASPVRARAASAAAGAVDRATARPRHRRAACRCSCCCSPTSRSRRSSRASTPALDAVRHERARADPRSPAG